MNKKSGKRLFFGCITLIALMLCIGTGCPSPTDSGGGGGGSTTITPQTMEYNSVDSDGNAYQLSITENFGGAKYTAKQGDRYILTIVLVSGGMQTSSGTVAGAGAAITLRPSKGSGTITVQISGEDLTGITIPATVKDDDNAALPISNAPITLAPLTAEEYLAAKLAAEINAIRAGSATAEGATVKLAADTQVGIPSTLTVPAGVTLDVTAGGAALILGSQAVGNTPVTLTVNGTVIAGSDHVRLEDSQWGAATINGSGTIRLNGKGNLLYVEGNKNVANRKIILDGVTLVGLEDNDQALVYVGKGGEFVMESGVITGNSATSDNSDGGGVKVQKGGSFIMEGGKISGNSANGSVGGINGGGVYVADNGSVFTMSGGIISGNNVSGPDAWGGGVDVEFYGSFIMEGGEISGNSVNGSNYASGGGVDIRDNASFTMKGGTIYGNVSVANAGGNANETKIGGALVNGKGAAISVLGSKAVAKWGTGGTYTIGGVAQSGGSDIGSTDETLIATP
ncbi:MAG: hypothetical protein LBK62_10610 [Treponema sp.]|nr:hypothetical protein [Treponema sp.]